MLLDGDTRSVGRPSRCRAFEAPEAARYELRPKTLAADKAAANVIWT